MFDDFWIAPNAQPKFSTILALTFEPKIVNHSPNTLIRAIDEFGLDQLSQEIRPRSIRLKKKEERKQHSAQK